MKRLFIPSLILILAAISIAAMVQDEKSETVKAKVKWISIEEAIKLNQKEPKKWLVDCYTSWCGWCKRMDATTFTDPHIVKELNDNFYAVKFDAESKRDIKVGDKVYKFVPQGNRGYHELAKFLMNGKMTYPTMVYLDETMKVIQPIPGYQDSKTMLPILTFFSSNEYKSKSWQDYLSQHESPYN